MDVFALAETILGFITIVVVGWALKRAGLLSAKDARPINNIIIYAGLPALIFRAVHPAVLDRSLVVVALIAWVVFAVSAVLSWLVCRGLHLSRPTAGGFILAASLGNTGYIGYPISLAVLGDEGLVRAIFYDVFGTVAALLLVALFIAQRMGDSSESGINPLREALAFPAVLALAAALLLRPVTIPSLVGNWLDALASLVVPLIMISVGLSLRASAVREHVRPLVALSVLRLIVAPVVAIALGAAVLDDPAVLRLVVLESSMPAMMLTLVVGMRFKLDTDFIAAAILVTTLTSVLTIPLMQALIG